MHHCPLCGLELADTDLARHYLQDPELVKFIQETHRVWQPDDGACAACLEMYSRESKSKDQTLQEERTDETTVITHPEQLMGSEGITHTASLITIHGNDLGKKFDLQDGDMIIGRGERAFVRVNEENVSRQHARIYKRGAEVIIEDLKSTNGTFVNTKKISSQPLKDGDLILIGNTILKFVAGSNVETRFHEEMYRLATLDGLTHVYNKAFFVERVMEEFGRSKRYHRDLSLILLDFDLFKQINDTYGHLAGDEILRRAATLVMRNLRKEDVLGRYGGEEFGILLPETALESASQIAEKMRKLMEKTAFVHSGISIHVTISVGVATLVEGLENVTQLLEAADQALYRAKAGGRNRVNN